MRKYLIITCTICLLLPFLPTRAQDTARIYDKIIHSPDKFFGLLNKKSRDYQQKIIKGTDVCLRKLSRREKELLKKLQDKDSAAARRLSQGSDSLYQVWQRQLKTGGVSADGGHMYNGHLDSIRTALTFLEQNNLLGSSAPVQQQLTGSLQQYAQLQGTLDRSDKIRQLVAARQQYLSDQLQQSGLGQAVKGMQREVSYYQQQANEYKEMFEKPEKMEAKLLDVLRRQSAFQQFFNKYSLLAGIFRMPGGDGNGAAVTGMQTRSSVMQDLSQRLGGDEAARQAMSQGMEQGQQQLDQLKNKIMQPGDDEGGGMGRKTELGLNVQSTRTHFFPATTDIGLNVGYKLNSRSVVGIGTSYKMGWGENIQHIHISSQGVGLRSFLDWKLKGNLWITGGVEMNYLSAFRSIAALRNYSAWQQSALLGLTKKISTGKKLKANVQLLYDFLYNRQVPQTQPLLFRVGYSLK